MELEFAGFESLHGFDEDIMYAIQNFLDKEGIPSEYTGTLCITIEYRPPEEDIDDKRNIHDNV